MKVLAAINDPGIAQKILRHLGLPTDTPRCAPARAPPEMLLDFAGNADFDAAVEFETEADDAVDQDDGFDPHERRRRVGHGDPKADGRILRDALSRERRQRAQKEAGCA